MADQGSPTNHPGSGPLASAVVVAEPRHEPHVEPVAGPGPQSGGGPRRRWIVLGAVGAVLLGLFFWKGRPWLEDYFRHIETDDAYVTGDTTVLPARISDVVEAVFVDNTDFVQRGAVLVRLDRIPFELAVQQRKTALAQAKLTIDQQVAALEGARADLERARDTVRGQLAALHANWHAVEGRRSRSTSGSRACGRRWPHRGRPRPKPSWPGSSLSGCASWSSSTLPPRRSWTSVGRSGRAPRSRSRQPSSASSRPGPSWLSSPTW